MIGIVAVIVFFVLGGPDLVRAAPRNIFYRPSGMNGQAPAFYRTPVQHRHGGESLSLPKVARPARSSREDEEFLEAEARDLETSFSFSMSMPLSFSYSVESSDDTESDIAPPSSEPMPDVPEESDQNDSGVDPTESPNSSDNTPGDDTGGSDGSTENDIDGEDLENDSRGEIDDTEKKQDTVSNSDKNPEGDDVASQHGNGDKPNNSSGKKRDKVGLIVMVVAFAVALVSLGSFVVYRKLYPGQSSPGDASVTSSLLDSVSSASTAPSNGPDGV